MPAKYVVRDYSRAQPPRGRTLHTNVAIAVGEEIIKEEPLGIIGPLLHDIFNDETFFNSGADYNGVEAITRMYNSMSDNKKRHFDRLHDRTNSNDEVARRVGRVTTNSFSDQQELNGQEIVTIIVQDVISRANHSCRPNAVYAYNSTTGRGALRAISALRRGDEILVNYLSSAEKTLVNAETRIAELMADNGFQCDCPACNANDHGEDNRQRRVAASAHSKFEGDDFSTADRQGFDSAEGRTWRTRGTNMIQSLSKLGLHDYRLSGAYISRARVHYLEYVNSARVLPRVHCNNCGAPQSPWVHLYFANQDLATAASIERTCYGPDHPKSATLQQQWDKIRTLMSAWTPVPLPG